MAQKITEIRNDLMRWVVLDLELRDSQLAHITRYIWSNGFKMDLIGIKSESTGYEETQNAFRDLLLDKVIPIIDM